jgi:DNA phosphorothioation-dependent restriction protein DptH
VLLAVDLHEDLIKVPLVARPWPPAAQRIRVAMAELAAPLAHRLVGDDDATLSLTVPEAVQQAAGAFVLRKLYRDMFQWGTNDRLRLAIVLDEAHRLAKDVTLPKIMKEGRKFEVAVIVASQGMGDFHPDVLATAGTKVLFRVNFPESRKLAGFIRARQGQDLATRMEQLAVGTAFVQTPEMTFGAQVRMYPLD